MVAQVTDKVDYGKKAEVQLQRIREDCHRWPVDDEIKTLREYLSQAGLTLADIGSSEDEIFACFREGHKNSAKNWLKVARENENPQNVKIAIEHIRNRLAEANLTLDDIGTSEKELDFLVSARQPVKGFWQRLFRRQAD